MHNVRGVLTNYDSHYFTRKDSSRGKREKGCKKIEQGKTLGQKFHCEQSSRDEHLLPKPAMQQNEEKRNRVERERQNIYTEWEGENEGEKGREA